MSESDSDKSEDATQHKLDEARKQGNVAKSVDMVAVGTLAAGCLVLYGAGLEMLYQIGGLTRDLLGMRAGLGNWSADGVAHWLGNLLVAALCILGPLLFAVVVLAVLGNLLQTGPVFSLEPLQFSAEKLNPVNGLKRLFSMRTVFDTVKSVFKIIVLGWVLYMTVVDHVPGLVGLPLVDPARYLAITLGLVKALFVKLLAVVFLLALLDMLFTRWEFGRRMRMSKQEVKDEFKNREGDPRIRARIGELRRELRKRSNTIAKVPSADVLIMNPTHFAVALSYKHGASSAPKVIAKGAGEVALQMRDVARRHAIPVVQNKLLARTLFREVDFDGYVPEKLYPQLAKIMVWVYANRKTSH